MWMGRERKRERWGDARGSEMAGEGSGRGAQGGAGAPPAQPSWKLHDGCAELEAVHNSHTKFIKEARLSSPTLP